MITALLVLLFIVKPNGHLTQCLLYKTLQRATKKQTRLKFNILFEKVFFYKIQHYTNQGLFFYANLGFYKVNTRAFFCHMYQFFTINFITSTLRQIIWRKSAAACASRSKLIA